MALVKLNLQPSHKQLRDFADIALCMCNVFGLILFGLGRIQAKGLAVFCVCGVIVYVLSRISVRLVKPIYQAMILATFPIGWVVSHLAMGVFYYGVITPVALVFKLIGRDPLNRSYDPKAKTYWSVYRPRPSMKEYFNQF